MKKFTAPVISAILAAANAAASAYYVSTVEADVIPTHYDLYMNPDRFGSKWEILAIPGVVLAIAILFFIYRACTWKDENHRKNAKYEDWFLIIIVVGFCLFTWFITLASTGAITPTRRWLPGVSIILGVLFVLYSNISGKLRQQPNFGIKTWATLTNSTVWHKTHRLSGILGVIMGILTILGGIFSFFVKGYEVPIFTVTVVGFLVLAFLVPTVYADILRRKLGSDTTEEEEK